MNKNMNKYEKKMREKMYSIFYLPMKERGEAIKKLPLDQLELFTEMFIEKDKIYFIVDAVHFYRIEREMYKFKERYDIYDFKDYINNENHVHNHIVFVCEDMWEAKTVLEEYNKKLIEIDGIKYTKEHLEENIDWMNAICEVAVDTED